MFAAFKMKFIRALGMEDFVACFSVVDDIEKRHFCFRICFCHFYGFLHGAFRMLRAVSGYENFLIHVRFPLNPGWHYLLMSYRWLRACPIYHGIVSSR